MQSERIGFVGRLSIRTRINNSFDVKIKVCESLLTLIRAVTSSGRSAETCASPFSRFRRHKFSLRPAQAKYQTRPDQLRLDETDTKSTRTQSRGTRALLLYASIRTAQALQIIRLSFLYCTYHTSPRPRVSFSFNFPLNFPLHFPF
jgi:hypothetical protein